MTDNFNFPVCTYTTTINWSYNIAHPDLGDIDLHHILVNTWEGGVDAEQNVVLVSIPSVIDPKLAPEGHHTLHAYLPATEPFEKWEHLERGR